MGSFDLIVSVVCIIQPLILFLLLAWVGRPSVTTDPWFNPTTTVRLEDDTTRFFEAAGPHSNINTVEYGFQSFVFVVMFIIYDVDLLFFLVEVMVWDVWSLVDLSLLFSLLVLIWFGLFYDLKKKSLHWL